MALYIVDHVQFTKSCSYVNSNNLPIKIVSHVEADMWNKQLGSELRKYRHSYNNTFHLKALCHAITC